MSDLKPVPCPTCGIVFGVPSAYYAQREKDYKDFRCPNGHNLHFIKPAEKPAPPKMVVNNVTPIKRGD